MPTVPAAGITRRGGDRSAAARAERERRRPRPTIAGWGPATSGVQWLRALLDTQAGRDLNPAAWAVVASLARHANGPTSQAWTGVPTAWPSAALIAAETGVGISTITKSWAALESLGAIRRITTPGKSTRWALFAPRPARHEADPPRTEEGGPQKSGRSINTAWVGAPQVVGLRPPETGAEEPHEEPHEEGGSQSSPYCRRHPRGTNDNCRGCGDARRAHDDRKRAEKEKRRRAADAATLEELRRGVGSTPEGRARARALLTARSAS